METVKIKCPPVPGNDLGYVIKNAEDVTPVDELYEVAPPPPPPLPAKKVSA